MPIFVEGLRDGTRIIAGQGCARAPSDMSLQDVSADLIEIGIVNNMPDTAIEATEQQLLGLLADAADHRWCRVRFFALPGVARGQRGRDLTVSYSGIDELCDADLDGLIVTGMEPKAPSLRDEPYWAAFAKVVDWAAHNTASTIWSCLASHAAVLHLDGIVRAPLDEKCFGVFDCEAIANHPMTMGLPRQLRIPHARYNGLPEEALVSKGYDVITRSREAGVDMFARNRRSLFLFLQGHPEYGPYSLLNEYRRDIGRFLRGERESYPTMPQHYFDREAADAMLAFQRNALANRCDKLLDEFPAASAERKLIHAWRPSAVQIYRNWLSNIAARTSPRFGRIPVENVESDTLVV